VIAAEPRIRVWTEGAVRRVTVVANGERAVMSSGEQPLLEAPIAHALVALVVWLELGPRPVAQHPAIRLAPSAMAILIGRGQAHGHGLAPEVARELQARLDAGVRHWTVRVEAGGRRRNHEVVDGPGGIWRVRPAAELVELAPTSSTAVVRELIALVHGLSRREDRPAAP
jgi:hypothetical protein